MFAEESSVVHQSSISRPSVIHQHPGGSLFGRFLFVMVTLCGLTFRPNAADIVPKRVANWRGESAWRCSHPYRHRSTLADLPPWHWLSSLQCGVAPFGAIPYGSADTLQGRPIPAYARP